MKRPRARDIFRTGGGEPEDDVCGRGSVFGGGRVKDAEGDRAEG